LGIAFPGGSARAAGEGGGRTVRRARRILHAVAAGDRGRGPLRFPVRHERRGLARRDLRQGRLHLADRRNDLESEGRQLSSPNDAVLKIKVNPNDPNALDVVLLNPKHPDGKFAKARLKDDWSDDVFTARRKFNVHGKTFSAPDRDYDLRLNLKRAR